MVVAPAADRDFNMPDPMPVDEPAMLNGTLLYEPRHLVGISIRFYFGEIKPVIKATLPRNRLAVAMLVCDFIRL